MHVKVQNALQRYSYPYTLRAHAAFPNPIQSPGDFARALGYDLGRITKSVFFRSVEDKQKFAIAVCSADRKLNLSLVAGHLGFKRVTMASKTELAHQLGYPPTGVSPLGVVGHPVLMDLGLLDWPTILVGGGVAGVEVELEPHHLAAMTGAVLLPLTE